MRRAFLCPRHDVDHARDQKTREQRAGGVGGWGSGIDAALISATSQQQLLEFDVGENHLSKLASRQPDE